MEEKTLVPEPELKRNEVREEAIRSVLASYERVKKIPNTYTVKYDVASARARTLYGILLEEMGLVDPDNRGQIEIGFLFRLEGNKTRKVPDIVESAIREVYGSDENIPDSDRRTLKVLMRPSKEIDQLDFKSHFHTASINKRKRNAGHVVTAAAQIAAGLTAGIIGTNLYYSAGDATWKEKQSKHLDTYDDFRNHYLSSRVIPTWYRLGYESDQQTIPTPLYDDYFYRSQAFPQTIKDDIIESKVDFLSRTPGQFFGGELHVLASRLVESRSYELQLLDSEMATIQKIIAEESGRYTTKTAESLKLIWNSVKAAVTVSNPDIGLLLLIVDDVVSSHVPNAEDSGKLVEYLLDTKLRMQERLQLFRDYLERKFVDGVQDWIKIRKAETYWNLPEVYPNSDKYDVYGNRVFLGTMDYLFNENFGVATSMLRNRFDRAVLFASFFTPPEDRNVILAELDVPTRFMTWLDQVRVETIRKTKKWVKYNTVVSSDPANKLLDYFASDLYQDAVGMVNTLFSEVPEEVMSGSKSDSDWHDRFRKGTVGQKYAAWFDQLHILAAAARTANLPLEQRQKTGLLWGAWDNGWYNLDEVKQSLSQDAEVFWKSFGDMTESLFKDLQHAAASTVQNHVLNIYSPQRIPPDALFLALGGTRNLFKPQL